MAKKALAGIRIIEWGRYVAIPLATRLLASLGAEVIKVETLTRPELQWFGPTFAPGAMQLEIRALKRSVTLDVQRPEGKEIMEQLIKKSDVYMTNLTQEALIRCGLDFTRVRSLKDDLISVWQVGYGGSGPYKGYRAYGRLIQHACALSSITGWPDSPGVANVSFSDYHSALFNVLAVVGALERRRRTGQGCHIESAVYESGVMTMGPVCLDYQANKVVPERMENRHRFFAPHGAYPCKGQDRWCAIATTTEKEWKAFCRVLGNPDWVKLPQFTTSADRVKNAQELDSLIAEWTSTRDAYEVMESMQKAGVPAGVVAKGRDLANNEHLQNREFYKQAEYYSPSFDRPGKDWPVAGKAVVCWQPMTFSNTRVVFGPMHRPGQDNDYVYGKILGMSNKEIKKLAKEGVFA
jgi:benzylsuccinate CoA-transferase BbsF subunit